MNQNDVQTLEEIKAALSNERVVHAVKRSEIENPAYEVERALVTFLKHQLVKLQDNTAYETQVKDVIMERLSEATFPQLIALLEVMQKNNNDATQKVLAPFIAQNSDRTLLDTTRESAREQEAGDKIYSQTNDKDVLQGMQALSQLLTVLQSQNLLPETPQSTDEETDEERD